MSESVMKLAGADSSELNRPQDFPLEVSIRNIRLVQRIGDRDVIVDRMDVLESKWEEGEGEGAVGREVPIRRVIPSTNIEIPTPQPEPEKDKEDEDISRDKYHDSDTFINNVEDPTFAPTLATPPFYSSIIDELRNKYSKFRIRHDDDYIEKKLDEEATDAKKKDSVKLMNTPATAYHLKQKELARNMAIKQMFLANSFCFKW